MITYKTIVNACHAFAANHHIIKNSGAGELWQINDHDQEGAFEYPLMYMVDVPSSPGPKSWVYAFRVYFVSRVEAPKGRDGNPIYFEYTSEKSAMISCAQDFLSYWVQDVNYKLTIEQSLGNTTFIDAQVDGVSGCYIDIRFVVPFSYDSCVIPMDGVTPPPSNNVEIYVNDVLFYTVPPGSEPNIVVKNENGDLVGNKIGSEWIVPNGGSSIAEVTNSDGSFNDSFDTADNPYTIPDSPIIFNGSPATSLPATSTKTIDLYNNLSQNVGQIVFDDAGNMILLAPDGTFNIKDSAGNSLTGDQIAISGGPVVEPVISDSILTLKNSLGTTIQTETLKAQEAKDGTITDVSWTDSDGSAESTPYGVAIVCTPVPPTPQEIGTVFDIDFSTLANLSDFTVVNPGGASYTLDGGYLKITGTPSTSFGGNALMYNNYLSGLKKYRLEIDYIIKSLPASNEGIIGTIKGDSTISPTIRKDSFVHFRNTASPANGHGYRYFNDTSTLTPNIFSTAPLMPAVSPVIDRAYKMIIDRDVNNYGSSINMSIVDSITQNSNNGTLTYNYANTSGQLDHSSSNFGVGTIGGTHWVSRMKLITTEKINADILFVVDSIGTGYCADSRANSYFEEIVSAHPDLVIVKSGLQGDKPSTAANRSAEFILINASKYFFHIGTNGVTSIGAVAAFADYQTMVNNAIAAGGTEFAHGYALPRGGNAAMNTFNGLILSTYGGQPGHTVVDLNAPFNNGANAMNPSLSNSDGIHPNTAGHTTIFNLFNPLI
jgi:hypothetical protein